MEESWHVLPRRSPACASSQATQGRTCVPHPHISRHPRPRRPSLELRIVPPRHQAGPSDGRSRTEYPASPSLSCFSFNFMNPQQTDSGRVRYAKIRSQIRHQQRMLFLPNNSHICIFYFSPLSLVTRVRVAPLIATPPHLYLSTRRNYH